MSNMFGAAFATKCYSDSELTGTIPLDSKQAPDIREKQQDFESTFASKYYRDMYKRLMAECRSLSGNLLKTFY